MYIADEADKIIKKLQGPQLPIFLVVYAYPYDSFEISFGKRKIDSQAAPTLPVSQLYKAELVICVTDEIVLKSRSHPLPTYHNLLSACLEKFPSLLEQLQQHFPYRDFK